MTSTTFSLHDQLAKDTVNLGSWPLCEVLLMNDSQYPWLILVPRRPDLREIYQLDEPDLQQFMRESCWLGRQLMDEFGGDKLNVAALGNQVPQLHIHHVVRFREDVAWPAPIWGRQPPQPYTPQALATMKERLTPILRGFLTPA